MPAIQSTAVGFRIRGLEPTDLSTYPDKIKLMFWQWVTELALKVKDKELAKGWDKDGNVHPLKPATIKHRKSEMGPTSPRAPRGEPSYGRSRVRSLLTGRAHLSSAELWWKFDSHTGRSFAEILGYWREEGHDVFGITTEGLATIKQEALKKWKAWIAAGGYKRPVANVRAHAGTVGSAKVVRKAEILKPISKFEVRKARFDLQNMDLAGDQAQLEKAITEGRFSGFQRLVARGEKWTPETGGAGPGPGGPTERGGQTPPAVSPPAAALPKPTLTPTAKAIVDTPEPIFGPSKAAIELPRSITRETVEEAMNKILGRQDATLEDMAGLAGAPDDALVKLVHRDSGVFATVEKPGVFVQVTLKKRHDGTAILDFNRIDVDETGKGSGTAIFGRMFEHADKLGLKRIEAKGARGDDNGYYTWPRVGFDGTIPDELRAKLPAALQGATQLSDLMKNARGRAWWKKEGDSVDVVFDLAPGSLSRKIWRRYAKAKGLVS